MLPLNQSLNSHKGHKLWTFYFATNILLFFLCILTGVYIKSSVPFFLVNPLSGTFIAPKLPLCASVRTNYCKWEHWDIIFKAVCIVETWMFWKYCQYKVCFLARGGADYRPVIHYRDLDAPREPEEFIWILWYSSLCLWKLKNNRLQGHFFTSCLLE